MDVARGEFLAISRSCGFDGRFDMKTKDAAYRGVCPCGGGAKKGAGGKSTKLKEVKAGGASSASESEVAGAKKERSGRGSQCCGCEFLINFRARGANAPPGEFGTVAITKADVRHVPRCLEQWMA
ncbi:unnamed protein product [Phaeothamnion confervicola]